VTYQQVGSMDINLKNLDESRRNDYIKMTEKLNDPNSSDYDKKRAADVLYALKLQANNKPIQKLREDMRIAVLNGDRDKVEKLGEIAKKVDRDWRF